MSEFQRYAVYYLPSDEQLARFGASWLGWDVTSGAPTPQPQLDGIDLVAATTTPRKYGFHGTLKPPFRLAEGSTAEGLAVAVASLAQSRAPVQLTGLKLAGLGRFLALVPENLSNELADLAFTIVQDLDHFRAPPSETELARRRSSGLTPRQDALLETWGYPYVDDEFRFHMTLSGKLEPDALAALLDAAKTHLPEPPSPYPISEIALVGERPDGLFKLIQRYALTG